LEVGVNRGWRLGWCYGLSLAFLFFSFALLLFE
jgi:hypothetical protein